MSLFPAFRAVLAPDVTEARTEALEKDIRALKGVVQVAFNQSAAGEKYLHVTCMPGQGIERKVVAMGGVARTQSAPF